MNDNTILRIKVPAHLYESVKEQLTINEAAKAKAHYGAGMELVKEKKMKTPKDGMHKVEEADKVEETNQIQEKEMEKKHRSLDELKAAKAKLEKKIEEMEGADRAPVEENVFADPNFWAGVGGILLGSVPFIKMKYDAWKNSKTPEEKKKAEAELANAISKKMGGGM